MFGVSYVGRLAADSELRTVGDNQVLSFRTATNSRKGSEEVTVWASVSYWGKGAAKIQEYLKKGREVFVTGSLTTREYEVNGDKRLSLDVRADNVRLVGGSKSDSNEHAKSHASNTSEDASDNKDESVPF